MGTTFTAQHATLSGATFISVLYKHFYTYLADNYQFPSGISLRLMLKMKILSVYCEYLQKHVNTMRGQNRIGR